MHVSPVQHAGLVTSPACRSHWSAVVTEHDQPLAPSHLLGVVLVQLCLASVTAPQAEDLVLGRVGHVDESLEPPALNDDALDAPQDQAVITHLEKHQLPCTATAADR